MELADFETVESDTPNNIVKAEQFSAEMLSAK